MAVGANAVASARRRSMSDARPSEPCSLCGGRERRVVVTAYDRMQARAADYHYARCAGCGLLALVPLPSASEIPGLYPSDYHDRIATWERNLDKPVNRLAIRYFYGVDSVDTPGWVRACFRAGSRRILRGICEPRGENRLLDIGCGNGATLSVYRRLGWRTRGIDVSPQAAAACRRRGLTVHQGTVFDAPFGAEFDLVLLSHVIEHVREPIAMLQRAAGFLAPGGAMVVSTPNARGIGFALYRSCWFALDAPRHLFLFDPRTIRLASDQAGLRVRRIVTRSTPETLRESRRYAATQGQVLPADLARRTAIVERSWRQTHRFRTYRDLMTPLTLLTALAGRGDVMDVELGAAAQA